MIDTAFIQEVRDRNPHLTEKDIQAIYPSSKPKAAAKYRNIPTEVDGHRFDSKKEAQDYVTLKLLEQAGQIEHLTLQPRFVLQDAFMDANGVKHRKMEYVADFMWRDKYTGKIHVKDTKGFSTKEYRLKARLFRKLYPQYVYEVG
jgi:hypothetical protein